MYEFLEGRIAARRAARLVVDVNGVGYDLAVPVGANFIADAEGRVRVFTHLVVREDAQLLYGFPDLGARDLFRQILRVRGVGPGMALGLLSGLGATEFLRAVVAGDVAKLTTVKGVGKKTADQILLDLRDRAQLLVSEAQASEGGEAAAQPPTTRANVDDAIAALISLGYSEKEAKKAVERAAKAVDPSDLEILVKQALAG